MRPIDAGALNTSLENHCMPFGQGTEEDKQFAAGFNAGLNRAQYTAAYAPTITPAPRWIPVEERLPEKDGFVLVYMDGRPGAPWEIVYCYGGRWALGCQAAKSVTHWMPLPEPPKEATP